MSTHRPAGSVLTSVAIGAALMAFAQSVVAQTDDEKNHYILECGDRCNPIAIDVAIGSPTGITTDAAGNVYFTSEHVVFMVDRAGRLRLVAGAGRPGFGGDGGPAGAALLNMPAIHPIGEPDMMEEYHASLSAGIAVDFGGNVYFADLLNGRIRRVDPGGTISTVEDRYEHPNTHSVMSGIAVAPNGDLYISGSTITRRETDGSIIELVPSGCDEGPGACGPAQIALDSSGAVIFPDVLSRVRRWSEGAGVVTIAGPALGSALSRWPHAVAVDRQDRVYIADTGNHCIRMVDESGVIRTVAGICGYTTNEFLEGADALNTTLRDPRGIAIDDDGNLYISDTGNRRVLKVTPDKVLTTVAGNGLPLTPPSP